MGGYNRYGKASVNPEKPRAFGVCDRCSNWTNHHKMRWQFEWNATELFNKRILVCDECYDKPQVQFRQVVIPADPPPIFNVRPENFAYDNVNYRTTLAGSERVTEDGSPRLPDSSVDDASEPL